MEAYALSLAVGFVSVVLAGLAISLSIYYERRSRESYELTSEALSEIRQKSAVIETTVNTAHTKLLDTVTDIAKPIRETQEEMLIKTMLPAIMQSPEMFERLIKLGEERGQGTK